MEFVYIVVENGEAYSHAYKTYEAAVQVVHNRHAVELQRQMEELPEYRDQILGDMNPKEDPSGTTFLFLEKETRINIHKLPIAGGHTNRKNSRRNRRTYA